MRELRRPVDRAGLYIPAAQAPLISLVGYTPMSSTAQVTQLTGRLGDENAASNVNLITPQQSSTLLAVSSGTFAYSFPANSFTIVRLQ